MSKKKMYELDVTNVFYWQETNDNNYVFHKQKTPFKLYLTKYGNKNQYMDLITGIVLKQKKIVLFFYQVELFYLKKIYKRLKM